MTALYAIMFSIYGVKNTFSSTGNKLSVVFFHGCLSVEGRRSKRNGSKSSRYNDTNFVNTTVHFNSIHFEFQFSPSPKTRKVSITYTGRALSVFLFSFTKSSICAIIFVAELHAMVL